MCPELLLLEQAGLVLGDALAAPPVLAGRVGALGRRAVRAPAEGLRRRGGTSGDGVRSCPCGRSGVPSGSAVADLATMGVRARRTDADRCRWTVADRRASGACSGSRSGTRWGPRSSSCAPARSRPDPGVRAAVAGPAPGLDDRRHRHGSEPDALAGRARAGSTRPTCSHATSSGSRTDPPDVGNLTARVVLLARGEAPPDAAREYVWSERGPEVAAGNGSVMYCAPLGVAYANRPGRAARARARALGPHALGRALPHRVPRGHARRRGARPRRDRPTARSVAAVDGGRGPRGRRGARVPRRGGRARAADRRPRPGLLLFTAGVGAPGARPSGRRRRGAAARGLARRRHRHERRRGRRAARRARRSVGAPGGLARTARGREERSRPRRSALARSSAERRDARRRPARMAGWRRRPTSARSARSGEIVTAMFADLVGSTALGERLDPEELKLIVGDAVARVIGAVEAFGGTVKDLAGDGVLALFGAPTAHEDDPERAVRAGAAGRRGDRRLRRGGRARVGHRAGSASASASQTGPVVVGAIGAGRPGRVRGARRRREHRRAAAVARPSRDGARRRGDACAWSSRCSTGASRGARAQGQGRAGRDRVARRRRRCARPGDCAGSRASQARLVGRERELDDGRRARRRGARRHRRHPVPDRRAGDRQDAG